MRRIRHYVTPVCSEEEPCLVERADADQRTLEEQITYTVETYAMHAIAYDGPRHRLLLATTRRAGGPHNPADGYVIRTIPFAR